VSIEHPYLLFLGDAADPLAAKTAAGVAYWRPQWCVGQFRLEGCNADLGLPDLTVEAAAAQGAKTVVVGVVNRGGVMGEHWIDVLELAIDCGMDVASGLHNRLIDVPHLVAAAAARGRRLFDVRQPPPGLPLGTGAVRPGKRLLTVGSDVSVGKMFTVLALEREMRARGRKADFRATGQTGVLIAGEGISVDAVVADFISGAAELLSPANDHDHWDLIEGQGSLYHPSYAGVSLGLLHGSQADALVMCHEPTRAHMRGIPGRPLPDLKHRHRPQHPGDGTRSGGVADAAPRGPTRPAVRRSSAPRGRRHRRPIARDGPAVGMRRLAVSRETWPIRGTFTISRGSKTAAEVVVATITEDGLAGRGECVPYPRYGETVAGVVAEIERVAGDIEAGLEREALIAAMPAGAARNALDCALWDLAAKLSGVPAWRLAGLAAPEPRPTAAWPPRPGPTPIGRCSS
jgi:uncharacterized NAD-dependent epimerase/dehydratase family protein